jgi:phenylacetate-CoA ligase
MNNRTSLYALKLHERLTNRHILTRLEELNQTQKLSQDELLTLQRDKLLSLVDYAMRYVPYYRRLFKQIDFHPDDLRRDLGNLNRIPVLTKSIIRSNQDDMLTTEPKRRQQLSRLCTSGSTGEPLTFYQDRDFRDAVTADIQRHMGWAGWKLGDPQAILWGAKFNPGIRQRARVKLIDWVWNRFQLNAFALTEESLAKFTKLIIQKKPSILFGYPSGIHRFAQYMRERSDVEISFNGIFTSAEKLLPPIRQLIEDTFRCRIFDRYGALELGGIACECPAHAGLHVSTENNYVEILRDGSAVQPGVVGNLVVTNLNNRGMPFIRYRNEDMSSWDTGGDCSCGRAAPRLASIEGRMVETFYTRDGRSVWSGFAGAAFRCLTHPSIKQFQVIQKSLDKMVVRLVQDGKVPQAVLDEILHAIQTAYGQNVSVDFEFPEEIPPLPSGKHQYAMSELNKS